MNDEPERREGGAAAKAAAPEAPRHARTDPGPPESELEFPGCRPVRMNREELDDYEGRIEYWTSETQTAWVMREPPSDTHELPSHRLAELGARIADRRGSPIRHYGTVGVTRLVARDEPERIVQPDQTVYLNPRRARMPRGEGVLVGVHDAPDVVLEVDHTTDVRRNKLRLYEAWGFPEIWREVPERIGGGASPRRNRPGLTIYVMEQGSYRPAAASRAFPGWTAAEIHEALNERELSAETVSALERVGRALGAREGTGPDDMPWLRAHRAESRKEGEAAGRKEGRAEGEAIGREKARAGVLETVMRKVLASRGIAAPAAPFEAREWAGVNDEDAMDAMLRCADAADLRARLGRLRG